MSALKAAVILMLSVSVMVLASSAGAQPTPQTEGYQVMIAKEFLLEAHGGNGRAACHLLVPRADGSRLTARELQLYMRELHRFVVQSNVQVPEGADVTFESLWDPITVCVAFVGEPARHEQLVDLERTVQLALGLDEEEMAALRRSIGREAGMLNLKDVCLAALTYANRHGGNLPPVGEWTAATEEYLDNDEYLACPPSVGAELRFALNTALAGADCTELPRPGATVMFFSSAVPGPDPAGIMDEMAGDADDMVYLGFADGHVQLMRLAEVPPEMFDPWEKGP